MSVQYEELEHNLVKLTIEIPLETIKAAEDTVYKKMRGRMTIPGFRKGKAPRNMIEHVYGKGIFLEDAVNDTVPYAYEDAVAEVEKEHGIKVASYPEIDYTQIEIEKPVIFTATVAKRPEVKLGKYKGIKIDAVSTEVTDEDIQKELESQQNKNASIVPVEGRPVADGDIVNLDFLGKVDGVAFEGGEGKDYPLTIGSGSFIPGFEEQLIGMNVGDTKDVEVTFPEDYHAKELAGKPAVFTCTINAIKVKELPPIDDELAAEVSDFETLEEYKADIRKKLTEEKEETAKRERENAVVDKIIESAEMDIPELMIKSEAKTAVNNFAQQLRSQGMSIEQYMQYTGQTEDDLIEAQKPQTLKSIQSRLVLEAVVKAENIEASEEDVEAEIARMAEQYKMEAEKIRSIMGDEQIAQMKEDLAVQKALDFVRDQSK
ncbi:MAG: trigger factor [Lachnospiraceae bacterium]|nr:trigger factor [Lachnospiraceae bacterium]